MFKMTVLLFIISQFSWAHASSNQTDNKQVQQKIVLTVATTENGYYPYNFEENGKRVGLSIDVLDYIEANSNLDFEFIVLSWPRALKFVSQGKVDMILTLFKSIEREKEYHFIEPFYGHEVNQIFSLTGNQIEFDGQLKQLESFSIGTTRDYSYGQSFDQAKYLTKLPATSEEALIKLLLAKRIDLAISNPLTFNKAIADKGLSSKVTAIKPFISVTPIYMALTRKRKKSDNIAKLLESQIERLKSSGYYQTLLDKYKLNLQ
ncbi:substrate-binding periplasmic protein [Paraglaciecola sp.]|uniref:substrate-binding periplasmic protein n=1 Tax=Paraglaciecola sp. TaxID=1920173 RepID=UPI003EF93669